MYKKQIVIGVFIWISILFIYIQLFYYSSPAALQAYQNLMQLKETNKQKNSPNKEKRSIRQQREQISKQLLFMQDHQRVQLRLLSDHSELIFNQEGKEQEVKEYFKNLACLMQEKLVYVSDQGEELEQKERHRMDSQPKQYIRHLQAEKGVYFYQTGKLKANQVQFTHYLLPGHSWPALSDNCPSLLKGEVKEMEWILYKNNNPSFKAHDFYMILQEKAGW